MKKRYGVAVTIAALVVALGVGLLLSESLLRLFYPQTLGVWAQTRDGLILLRPTLQVFHEGFGTHVQTNSFGFRDREHELGKPAGTLRVLLLGDSFMEALQVDFQDAFPALLEGELQSLLGCRVEVISAGVSGWGTDDEVTYLKRKGAEFHPDVVLFAATLHNDISDNLEGRYHKVDQGELIEKPISELPWYTYSGLEMRSYLASHSHLYQIVYQSWKSLGRSDAGARLTSHVVELMRHTQSDQVKRGWWVTEKLLEEAKSLAKADGFKLAMFIIPTVYEVDERSYLDLIATYRLNGSDLNRDKPVETLAAILGREGIEVINLLPAFRTRSNDSGQQLYIQGDGHFNKEGHQLAAAVVSRDLVKTINEWESFDRCRSTQAGMPHDSVRAE
ncbi:MAG: hypothetical protein CAF45_016265 [Nitrospira sp. CG24E]|nr:MAG: hypothetical protein CAF45_016265 [Nitrospira sp. CG24E]